MKGPAKPDSHSGLLCTDAGGVVQPTGMTAGSSERKRLEKELQESEKRCRHIVADQTALIRYPAIPSNIFSYNANISRAIERSLSCR